MTTLEQPLVSVVTPFFNTDAYLAECIESVLAQTYRNFEYVLVDNHSTDRSVEIVERYAARDPRIRLLHTERFLSQLPNYNGAVRQISPASCYFKMVQADDAIFPRCLEEMVAIAEANPAVGVVSSFRVNGAALHPRVLPHTGAVMSGREAGRLFLLDDVFMFGSQTTVLVRSDIVRARDPFYGEDKLFSDTDVVLAILRNHDFAFVPQILSFTRVDPTSVYGSKSSYDPVLLHRLIVLKTFGSTYLSAEEYARCVDETEREYRRFLADAWLRRREPEFWEYHRDGLANIGETIDRGRFLRDAVPVVVQYALQPRRVASALLRRARHLIRGRTEER